MAEMIKVLVVDDETSFTRMVKLALEGGGPFKVATVNDPTVAVDTARRFLPDVIVMDVLMPEESGLDVAERFREHEHFKEVPIIFLTAAVTKENTKAWRTGVAGVSIKIDNQLFANSPVLVKPVGAGVLIKEIKKLVAC